MREYIENFIVDYATLERALPPKLSPARFERLRRFFAGWDETLNDVNFDALKPEERVDFLLFRNHLRYEERQLDIQNQRQEEIAPLIPFSADILNLESDRRRMEPVDAAQSAATLDGLNVKIQDLMQGIRQLLDQHCQSSESDFADAPGSKIFTKVTTNRAVMATGELTTLLQTWFEYYDGYDPLFSWWVREPFNVVRKALDEYVAFLRETFLGVTPNAEKVKDQKIKNVKSDDEIIIGDPIGREALLNELSHELIPYTPEELIAIGDREFAWCEAEMIKAAGALGYGEDWHAALEFVKTRHVEPGAQTVLVRDLALEAMEFVESRQLVTIPELARECWRMEMMSPERQKVSPFFLGGEVILSLFQQTV